MLINSILSYAAKTGPVSHPNVCVCVVRQLFSFGCSLQTEVPAIECCLWIGLDLYPAHWKDLWTDVPIKSSPDVYCSKKKKNYLISVFIVEAKHIWRIQITNETDLEHQLNNSFFSFPYFFNLVNMWQLEKEKRKTWMSFSFSCTIPFYSKPEMNAAFIRSAGKRRKHVHNVKFKATETQGAAPVSLRVI